ncbi:MAG: hypothetical protein WC725_05230 [Patescibacteria group bacterium]|jgi:hypothetical protein
MSKKQELDRQIFINDNGDIADYSDRPESYLLEENGKICSICGAKIIGLDINAHQWPCGKITCGISCEIMSNSLKTKEDL